jgi:hypothetical protein
VGKAMSEESKALLPLQHGGVMVSGSEKKSIETIRNTKIALVKVLNRDDFVKIGDVWEIKRDGALKILSALPFDYSWKFEEDFLINEYCNTKGILLVSMGDTKREIECVGFCDRGDSMFRDKQGNFVPSKFSNHSMKAKAETRALKRGIELAVGGIVNYFVLNNLLH